MQNIIEEWREIRDWEGLYEVSNLGRVRSVPRSQVRLGKGGNPTTFRYGYKLLRPGQNDNGYLLVRLSDMTNGRQQTAKVHRLVCEAFHGPQPSWDYEVAHKDHVRDNNVADNLRWVIHRDNIRESVRAARTRKGRDVADNDSGVIGVSWDKHKRLWAAEIGNKKLGKFKDFDDAVAARYRAEQACREQSIGVEGLSSAA
jgi:hypothetical protein